MGFSGRSAWSRHGQILEVGDLTKIESLNYLYSQNVDEATAEETYSLAGGRIIWLRLLLGALRVTTFERIYLALYQRPSLFSSFFAEARNELLRNAEAQFTAARLLPPGPLHKVGSELIKELLENIQQWTSVDITDY